MLVLRLMLMVLTIICLMDGHAEVSSSTTGIRNRRESPVVKPNESEVQILDRKKKKRPKKPKKTSKKKKPKPNKPKPAKPVTTTPTMTTSTLKTTTILTTPTMETTETTTDPPTTTATTFKITTSSTSTTTSVTTTTTTSTATTTEATSSTASITTATTTIPTTTTTTKAATTVDSGAGGECKATNGKPCIFPFKDGKDEYNECKNHGGTYFWCATAVYDSGKYKHWSYCPKDGPCPLEGDGKCRATNNKPCVFPFKDGGKEYNECADHGGKYFWCATGTNSAGKYTAWSECPKDGSCPLPQRTTTPVMIPTATAATTTLLTTDTSAIANAFENVENKMNEIDGILQSLETTGLTDDENEILETMEDLEEYFKTGSLTRYSGPYDINEINNYNEKLTFGIKEIQTKTISPGFYDKYKHKQTSSTQSLEDAILRQVDAGKGRMILLSTVSSTGTMIPVFDSSLCCIQCLNTDPNSRLFEYSKTESTCHCYKTIPEVLPTTAPSGFLYLDSGVCESSTLHIPEEKWAENVRGLVQAHMQFPPLTVGRSLCGGLTYQLVVNWLRARMIQECGPNMQCINGVVLSRWWGGGSPMSILNLAQNPNTPYFRVSKGDVWTPPTRPGMPRPPNIHTEPWFFSYVRWWANAWAPYGFNMRDHIVVAASLYNPCLDVSKQQGCIREPFQFTHDTGSPVFLSFEQPYMPPWDYNINTPEKVLQAIWDQTFALGRQFGVSPSQVTISPRFYDPTINEWLRLFVPNNHNLLNVCPPTRNSGAESEIY